MLNADWIALAVILAACLIGAIFGFGRTLKFFTSGIFGIIISFIVCYFLFGLVYALPAVQNLCAQFLAFLAEQDNFLCNVLTNISIDKIAVAVVLFILVQIVRMIAVALLKNILEIKNPLFKVINKLLGIIIMLAVVIILAMIVFQVIAWVGGSTAEEFAQQLDGSSFGLDWIFANNPLRSFFEDVTSQLAL